MRSTAPLDERSKEVLKSLIQLHIATGEPVGSESLARAMNNAVSSATLRNIMADLEHKGYLDHPHTSAGRMPTDEGYRFYVDTLLGTRPLGPGEAAAIESELRPRDGTASQVMENASHLLSRMSRSVGFVLGPDPGRTVFRHIDLVSLPPSRVLVVLVSWTGLVSNRVITLEEQVGQDDLQRCANYLNTNFGGLTLAAIRARLLQLMQEEKALYDSLLKQVIAVGERAFAVEGEPGAVYLDGASNILENAEFEDVQRLRSLFKTFEEKSRLVKILNACLGQDGLRILIGHENPDPGLHEMSIVAAVCPVEGEPGLGIGVLGSTRMEYGRVIPVVEHVAQAISRALHDLRT